MIVGICGGTGSGKTTVARRICEALEGRIVYLQQDSYYRDLSHLPFEQRCAVNFDHPDSVEFGLMTEHVLRLRGGEAVECPVYDFTQHTRRQETQHVEPQPAVLVEGILIFDHEPLRRLMDIKVFVDTEADVRFVRRLRRDLEKRGRTVQSVIQQYLETVRPMHLQFVEPAKRYADVIIPEGGHNRVGVEMVIEKVKSMLRESEAPARPASA